MQNAPDFQNIKVEELKHWLDVGKDVSIIDTLPREVYEQRHLPGAESACVYDVAFPDAVKEIVTDRRAEIVVYGSSSASKDAETAAEKLARLGYEKVYALEGGIAGWRRAGLPVEGEATDGPEDPGTRLKLADCAYKVDLNQSVIEWTGRNPNGKHHGTIQLSSGEIKVADETVNGFFEIDMRSIKNIDLRGDELEPVLIAHLESDDFFFVKMFPKARFVIKSAKPVSEPTLSSPNLEVEGTLELRRVKREVSFLATVSHLADGGISAEAHFDFDRTSWNVIYGSSKFFEHLGMHLVFDPISVQVRIVAL